MEFVLIAVGRTRMKFVGQGIIEYRTRLQRYTAFSVVELPDVKDTKSLTEDLQKVKEGEAILQRIQPSDLVILLDERGRDFSSVEYAAYLQKIMASGRKRVIFVIGGPYGFSKQVYDRADAKISLSRMTFNHEMVRMFFVEQLYRAMTILRNEPYHHE